MALVLATLKTFVFLHRILKKQNKTDLGSDSSFVRFYLLLVMITWDCDEERKRKKQYVSNKVTDSFFYKLERERDCPGLSRASGSKIPGFFLVSYWARPPVPGPPCGPKCWLRFQPWNHGNLRMLFRVIQTIST